MSPFLRRELNAASEESEDVQRRPLQGLLFGEP